MTSRDFCYWLQGYFEILATHPNPPSNLTSEQTACISKHLALVFKHEIDPSYGDAKHQKELNEIHNSEFAKNLENLENLETLQEQMEYLKKTNSPFAPKHSIDSKTLIRC